jgi:hypothetical protein
MDNHNIKSKSNYRQALEEKHINAEKKKKTNKQSNSIQFFIIYVPSQQLQGQ